MKYHATRGPLLADTQRWRQIRLIASVPKDPSMCPDLSLLLLSQSGRVPRVTWVESWLSEVPLGDPLDPGQVVEWFHGALWDRLDQ